MGIEASNCLKPSTKSIPISNVNPNNQISSSNHDPVPHELSTFIFQADIRSLHKIYVS